jgi:predicted TIM-barrel fold metal-dependent hydrolase
MSHKTSLCTKMQPTADIIDTHQHVFWHGRDDAGLVRDMDEHGIRLAWLLTFEIPPHPAYADLTQFTPVLNPARVRGDGSHPGILLEDLLVAHRNFPGRFVLGYCPDPAKPNAPALFEAACDMHGVRVCGEWKFRQPIDDPRSLELFRAAARRKAPVVLHLDVPYLPPRGGKYMPAWFGGTVENLERALQACPETIFIGHAPGFWRELASDAQDRSEIYPDGSVPGPGQMEALFDAYPNLYADLSARSAIVALQRDPHRAADFLSRRHDRILFARDYYGTQLHEFLQTLPLDTSVIENIYRENARRLVPELPV